MVQGLDSDWNPTSTTLTLAGTSASTASTQTFIRVFRAWVATTGTYTGANTGDVVIESPVTGDTLAFIEADAGQTQLSMFSIKAGYTAYIEHAEVYVEGKNNADVFFFQRQNADTVSAPFSAKRILSIWDGVDGGATTSFNSRVQIPAKSDLWFTVTTGSGSKAVVTKYDLVLVKN